jgi:hypothetical protein
MSDDLASTMRVSAPLWSCGSDGAEIVAAAINAIATVGEPLTRCASSCQV